jgi:NAD(P)-dependent dehydrogenase (short-subunit alcohol dehydrogenase family)
MRAAGGGSIIHLSSVDALGADGLLTAYPASKAAVMSLARTLAVVLAPLGIRVNSVAPGYVSTNYPQAPNVCEHMLKDFARVPIRRMVEPAEVAAAVAFLASEESACITGANIVVEGGLTANLFVPETLPPPSR